MMGAQRLSNIDRTPAQMATRFDKLRLDKNEYIPHLPDRIFREVMATIRPEHVSAHPELGPLYAKLSTRLGLAPDMVLLGAGSDSLIRSAFEVFVSEGDKVVFPDPSFAMYRIYAECRGAEVVSIGYGEDLSLDPGRIIDALDAKTSLLVMANPNSPTGTVIDTNAIEAILRRADGVGCAVLIDEAYYPFYDGTVLDRVGRTKNLIVTRTLSKAAGLAGLRVGFAAGDKTAIRAMTASKLMYEITGISAVFAEYMLDHYELLFEYAKEVNAAKRRLAAFLREAGFAVREGHANFIHVDFGNDRSRIVERLLASGVLFKDRFSHPSLRRYCRFSVGGMAATERFIDLLKGLL